MCQSSNDVIPAAIHVAAYLLVARIAAAGAGPSRGDAASAAPTKRSDVVKTGRTHLMDATPIRLGQQIGGWATQVRQARERIESTLPRLAQLALGGTAVGTGINAHPEFGARVAAALAQRDRSPVRRRRRITSPLQATQDTAAELSGQLKAYAVGLMKIANDLAPA